MNVVDIYLEPMSVFAGLGTSLKQSKDSLLQGPRYLANSIIGCATFGYSAKKLDAIINCKIADEIDLGFYIAENKIIIGPDED